MKKSFWQIYIFFLIGIYFLLFSFIYGCSKAAEISHLTITTKPLCNDMLMSVNCSNKNLQEVVIKLNDNVCDYSFYILNKEIIENEKKFSLNIDNKGIYQALDILSKETAMGIDINGFDILINPLQKQPDYTIATNEFWINLYLPISLKNNTGNKVRGGLCRCYYNPNEVSDVRLKSMLLSLTDFEVKEQTRGFGQLEWIIILPDKYETNRNENFEITIEFIKAKERHIIQLNDSTNGEHVIGNFELDIEKVQLIDKEKYGYEALIPFNLRKLNNLSSGDKKKIDALFEKATSGKNLTNSEHTLINNYIEKNHILRLIYAGPGSRRGKNLFSSFKTKMSPFYSINGEIHLDNVQILKRNDLILEFIEGVVEKKVLSTPVNLNSKDNE